MNDETPPSRSLPASPVLRGVDHYFLEDRHTPHASWTIALHISSDFHSKADLLRNTLTCSVKQASNGMFSPCSAHDRLISPGQLSRQSSRRSQGRAALAQVGFWDFAAFVAMPRKQTSTARSRLPIISVAGCVSCSPESRQ